MIQSEECDVETRYLKMWDVFPIMEKQLALRAAHELPEAVEWMAEFDATGNEELEIEANEKYTER
jgi:hypothetical protein